MKKRQRPDSGMGLNLSKINLIKLCKLADDASKTKGW